MTISNCSRIDLLFAVQALLTDPRAWDFLSAEEKASVTAGLPGHVNVETDEAGDPSIPAAFLKYDNDWRNGLRLFQEDLGAGRLKPAWLKEAAEAMEARARGDYDKWKDEQYESFWGQKQKLQSRVYAQGSSRMTMVTLVSRGILLAGDVWCYSRTILRPGQPSILMEKEVTVRSHSPSSSLGILMCCGRVEVLTRTQVHGERKK